MEGNTMKISYIISAAAAAILFSACSEKSLDFSPTSSGSGDAILSSATTAMSSLNGIYRSMRTAGWSTTGNTHQAFGLPAHQLAQEVMGDDFIMQARGNGWFWQDHCYTVKSTYTSKTYRSYDVWFANYNWINNVNAILDYKDRMSGAEEDVAYVVGQAYAIRAFCYFSLACWFSRAPILTRAYTSGERGSEVEHWGEKCVPIYTTATDITRKGNPRATLREVYDLIESDLDNAVTYLEKAQTSILNKGSKAHMNLYATLVLVSRVALAENDWQTAYDASMRVIDEGGYAVGGESELMSGMNLLSMPNVIWGAEIQNTEQASAYASFFAHMDNVNGAYAKSAPKRISKSLYNKIGENDIRRRWWDPKNEETPYISGKFSFSNVTSALGDVPYMRVEEAYFNAAEAAVRLDDDAQAQSLLNAVMSRRDPSYNAIAYKGTALSATTNTYRNSLLENIILQKRIEFWGEFGRVWDVRRLGQGISRSEDDGFSSTCITSMNNKGVDITSPGTWDWVLFVPKAEIDANPEIGEEDQNL